MKNFRWTLVFIVVVIALVALTLFDNKRSEKKTELSEKDKALIKVPTDQVTRLEIANRTNSVVLERKDVKQDWRVTQPMDDAADQSTVQSYISNLEAEKTIQVVISGQDLKTSGLTPYGLDNPVTRLRLKTADGKSEELKIGAVRAYDSNLYAQIDDGVAADADRVLLVSSGWDGYLTKTAGEFRDHHILRKPLKAPELTRILISYPANRDTGSARDRARSGLRTLDMVKNGEHWQIKAGADAVALSDQNVTAFLDLLKGVRLESFVDAGSTGVPVAQKALEKPSFSVSLWTGGNDPAWTVKFAADPTSAIVPSISSSGKKGGKGAQIKQEMTEPDLFASSSEIAQAVRVKRDVFTTIDKTDQDFYDKKQPFAFLPSEVEQAAIETPELKGHFEKKNGQWTVASAPSAAHADPKKEFDSAAFAGMLVKVSDLQAVRILEPLKKAGIREKMAQYGSRLKFSKADGTTIFELKWGQPTVVGGETEARYLPAVSSRSDHLLGLAEGGIQGLGFASVYKDKPATPVASAGAATAATSATATPQVAAPPLPSAQPQGH